jgi:uncharacterized protein (DUF1800 family)
MLNRIEWAKELAARLPQNIDPKQLAGIGLGPLLQPSTRAAMNSAATQDDAVALLLCSPEFQRR